MRALLVLALLLYATGAWSHSLRPKPSMQEIEALLARAIPKIALADFSTDGEDEASYLSTFPVAQFNDKRNGGRTETQIMDELLTQSRQNCKAFNSNEGQREIIRGIAFRRLSTDCLTDSGRVQYEAILAIDATRHQLFRLGGDETDQQERLKQIAIIYYALLVSYR